MKLPSSDKDSRGWGTDIVPSDVSRSEAIALDEHKHHKLCTLPEKKKVFVISKELKTVVLKCQ